MTKAGKSGGAPNAGNTAAVCYRLAGPVAAELGYYLWDVRFVKEGATWYLRIFIDKDGGVTIDDCVEMSHRMDKLLDEADPIPQSYCLEVCSPGIERELTRPAHFELCEVMAVAVSLYSPVDGMREFAGILAGYQDNVITIETEAGVTRSFNKKETSSVHLIDDEDEDEYGGETENE